ncbi:MAG TPA: polysaccharide pyruvyl transferase family protein, partial [Candidatus Paceibacterota bacterium]|nr:polysaccharide pyruvyl transferase family protein [Candidatus Paceibacterota bacterium]
RATAIFLREPETSVAWLQRMNADGKRICITGDDAIELAARQTPCASPNSIGVNLRLASYAGIQSGTVTTVREVLHRKADEVGSRLIGIPISQVPQDADRHTINILAPEDRELELMPWTTAAVIERVSHCRLVVTGSYHAGVFALAQGIPMVAIAQSEYYAGKFNGLARQFGCGCAVILSGEESFAAQLENAVAQAWHTTDAVKAELRAAAARQIAAGRTAYAQLQNLFPAGNHVARSR